MASNVLAKPSFLTGPNDKLATVDVFSGTAAGIVNSITSLAAKYDVDLIGMLRAGAAAAQVIPLVQGIANGNLLLNPQAAIARLLTASNVLTAAVGANPVTSAFNALSDGLQSTLSEAGQVMGQVEATVGGVVSTIMNGAVSDIQGLGGLINGFAGASTFLLTDNQALIGMAAGVINAAAKYGITGAFGAMVSQITNPHILNGIIRQTMPNLVVTSDLTSLQALVGAAGPAGISSINPSFLSSFTTTYNRNASGASNAQSTPVSDAATWNSIQSCYNAANPGWNYATRAGDSSAQSTIDLSSLQGGTDDFNSNLAAGVFASSTTSPTVTATDTTTPFYALAPVFTGVDPNQQLANMYPNTYFDPALRSTPQSVDPTQLQTGAGAGVSAATSTSIIQAATAPTMGTRPDGTISSAQAAANAAAGYNTGQLVFDDAPSSAPPPPANDRVANQPNPVTYQSVSSGSTTTTNNGINWALNQSPDDAGYYTTGIANLPP